jgi:hypothetical protein
MTFEEIVDQAIATLQTSRPRGLSHTETAVPLLGEIHAHLDPPAVEPVEEYYRKALSLANELEMCPLEAHFHRGLCLLYAKIGRPEDTGCSRRRRR